MAYRVIFNKFLMPDNKTTSSGSILGSTEKDVKISNSRGMMQRGMQRGQVQLAGKSDPVGPTFDHSTGAAMLPCDVTASR
ncbi:hypothetical protein V6N11_000765 [Hibiscus sabdariffa]|uniref:Uncharacterized protein n=1 Tax=Hibiscus sabdariffa TaxID=183260 RepID=A0ABR2RXQ2_9ROSI